MKELEPRSKVFKTHALSHYSSLRPSFNHQLYPHYLANLAWCLGHSKPSVNLRWIYLVPVMRVSEYLLFCEISWVVTTPTVNIEPRWNLGLLGHAAQQGWLLLSRVFGCTFWDIDFKLVIEEQKPQEKPLTSPLTAKRNLDRRPAPGREMLPQTATAS